MPARARSAAPSSPAAPGNTEQQLDAIERLKPTAYVGVPDYLKILLDKAERGRQRRLLDQEGAGRRRRAVPARCARNMRERGIAVFQAYATADVGIIAYESDGAARA